MSIKEILKKVTEGKELSDEEKSFLNDYDPEKDENRIPKTRLDQESAKTKAEKQRADELAERLAELQEKYDDLENAGKSEAEKLAAANDKTLKTLQKQVETLTKERDAANASLAKSERAAVISKIASTHNFSDSDYLDFLANSKELDLKDDSAVASFMKELSSSRPELFKSSAKPGGGTSGNGKNNTSGNAARLKELLGKDELTPREAAEVYELQSSKSGEGDGDSGEGAKQ